MKRIIVLLLAVFLLASFTACGMVDVAGTDTTGNALFVPDLNSDDSDDQGDNEDIKPIPFEEVVVVENEYCVIKITGIEENSIWGYGITAHMENKSPDKTYMFSVQSASVNGVKVEPLFATEVAAGKKTVEEIRFSEEDLKNNGIEQYTDIQLDFRVYDSNDWMADEVALVSAHIYPYGEENAVAFVREGRAEDILLVDNDKVTVTVTGFRTDDIWGYTADLFIVNKTETTIMVSADEASVNGFMADPFFATDVPAGKCAFSSISWSEDELEKYSITEVENIEFLLRVYDADNWLGDDFANEQIKLEP